MKESQERLEQICHKQPPHQVQPWPGMKDVSGVFQRSGYAAVLAELSEERAQEMGLTKPLSRRDQEIIIRSTLARFGISRELHIEDAILAFMHHCNTITKPIKQQQRTDRRTNNYNRRRARKQNAATEAFKRQAIIERDESICYLCGIEITGQVHLDHVIPLSKGGEHGPNNLRATHPECNIKKGSNLLTEEPASITA